MGEAAQLLLLLCVLCAGAVYVAHRTKLSTVICLLITGVLVAVVGPKGFGLAKQVPDISAAAELGIALLMFSVGLEFRPREFRRHLRAIVIGGAIQVALTVTAFGILLVLFGTSVNVAGYCAILLTLASTAIVIRELDEFRERAVPHGHLLLGISLFQDVIYPLLAFVAAFVMRKNGHEGLPFYIGYLIISVVVVTLWYLTPVFFDWVTSQRSPSLFFLAFIGVALLLYVAAELLHVSPAVAMFAAGVIVGRHQASYQGLVSIRELKEFFVFLFFISLGLQFDGQAVIGMLPTVFGALILVVFVKFVCATAATLLAGYSLRVAAMVGAGLVQIGELSFILAEGSVESGLLTPKQHQLFLTISILSMLLTPVMLQVARKYKGRLPDFHLWRAHEQAESVSHAERQDHVIIAGWGRPSHALAERLRKDETPVLCVDISGGNVRDLKQLGFDGFRGDISSDETLHLAGILTCRMIVISISDDKAAFEALKAATKLRPDVRILMRVSTWGQHAQIERWVSEQRDKARFSGKVEFLVVDQTLAAHLLVTGVELANRWKQQSAPGDAKT